MKTLNNLLSKFKREKRSPPPTLEWAWKHLEKMEDEFGMFAFSLGSLTDHTLTAPQIEFLTRAEFYLRIAKDEFKISINERKDREREEKYARIRDNAN